MSAYKLERDNAWKKLAMRENENNGLRETLKKLEKNSSQTEIVNEENELDRWLGKITQVRNFVKQHPQYAIPEFKYLTDRDWLSVTESGQLESEADYRKALAYLRQKAMAGASYVLSQAIQDFTKENGGTPPRNYEDIAKYLPDDFDRSRYMSNPSGSAPYVSSTRPQHFIITSVGPVDSVWDSGIWMNDKGQANVSMVNTNADEEVRAAISNYYNENGSMPTNLDQIRKHINKGFKINENDLAEVYKSIMTPVK